MIDFEKEFGHWYEQFSPNYDYRENPTHHRLKSTTTSSSRNPPICGFNNDVWLSKFYPIRYKNICKDCLNTYTKKELNDLKQYLIVKKLKS